MEMTLFETVLRRKMRFPYRGVLSAEDLFDLTQQELDELYRGLAAQVQSGDGLLENSKEDVELRLQLDTVRRVFEIKKAEAEEAARRARNRQRREKILAILEEKQEGSLREKSEEELRALLEEE